MYECWYVAIDIFGDEIQSDVLICRVTDLHKTEPVSIYRR